MNKHAIKTLLAWSCLLPTLLLASACATEQGEDKSGEQEAIEETSAAICGSPPNAYSPQTSWNWNPAPLAGNSVSSGGTYSASGRSGSTPCTAYITGIDSITSSASIDRISVRASAGGILSSSTAPLCTNTEVLVDVYGYNGTSWNHIDGSLGSPFYPCYVGMSGGIAPYPTCYCNSVNITNIPSGYSKLQVQASATRGGSTIPMTISYKNL